MSNGLATRPKPEIQVYLESNVDRLATVCNKFLTPERLITLVNLCTYKNRDLLKCDPETVLNSVVQAASLGLSLEPSSGEAYLIPRWNDKTKSYACDFQPGYQGLTKLARESGKVTIVQAVLVREGDAISVVYTPEPHIQHTPNLAAMSAPITHVYAWAKLPTGETPFEIMEIAEVEYIRSRSNRKTSGPWESDYGEMAKKTVIRRLCKSLPKTAQLAAAITADESMDQPDTPVSAPEQSAHAGLVNRLNARRERPLVDVVDAHGEVIEPPTPQHAERPEPAAEKPPTTPGTEWGKLIARELDLWNIDREKMAATHPELGGLSKKVTPMQVVNHLVKARVGTDDSSLRTAGKRDPAKVVSFMGELWDTEPDWIEEEMSAYLSDIIVRATSKAAEQPALPIS